MANTAASLSPLLGDYNWLCNIDGKCHKKRLENFSTCIIQLHFTGIVIFFGADMNTHTHIMISHRHKQFQETMCSPALKVSVM